MFIVNAQRFVSAIIKSFRFHEIKCFSFYSHLELPKKAILQKISMLRRERAAVKSYDYTKHESHSTLTVENDVSREALHKRQLILSTIEDLKRSLEDQSIELNGLNNDD